MRLSLLGLICVTAVASLLGGTAPCTCTGGSPQPFVSVNKKAAPAVVFIQAELSHARDHDFRGYDSPEDEFFERFFGSREPNAPQPQRSLGTGFLVSSDGYIMTNTHIVKGADKLEVTLGDGQVLPATLVGTDPNTDLAVVKIEGKDFPHLTFADSDKIEVGEWVAAIGCPFQLYFSLSHGVVSAKGRGLNLNPLEDFIQTDAAINPGNSGGPLLNLNAEVVGINTVIFTRSGGSQGIGFAISSNMAKHVMQQLMDRGSVVRGFLGVSLQPVDKEIAAAFGLEKVEGALAADVVKGSPADKAGLQQGDIILEYNGKAVKSFQTFRNDIALMSPGTKVALKVFRKGTSVKLTVVLGSASDNSGGGGIIAQKLGIEVDDLSPELAKQLGYTKSEEAVVITKIKPGSPAALAGLRPGFLILSINHRRVTNVKEYHAILEESEKSKRLLILARQGSATKFYPVRIE
jgi:serine protease Do